MIASILDAAMQDSIQKILAATALYPPDAIVQPCDVQRDVSKNKKLKDCKKYAKRYPKPTGLKLMEYQKTDQKAIYGGTKGGRDGRQKADQGAHRKV